MTALTPVSLQDALRDSIDRMKRGFDREWMFADGWDSPRYRPAVSPESVDDRYVRIFEPEYHGYTEICLCVSGCFAMQMDKRMIELEAGDLCLILPGVLHNELPRQNGDYIALWIVIDFNRAVLHLSGSSIGSPFFTFEGQFLKSDYSYIQVVESVRQELEQSGSYCVDAVKAHMFHLFVDLYRKLTDAQKGKQDGDSWKTSVVSEVKKYIKSNYTRPIRLNDISQIVCVSPNYLNTLFKTATGKTIMQYHEDYRMEMAKSLLREGEETINDISLKLGYYDQYHFSKIFKKATGMSPLNYRKSM